MYVDDMKQTKKKLKAAVFVEALPEDCVKEVEWVRKSMACGTPSVIVARADLTSSNIDEILARLVAPSPSAPVVGIRQILNWEPTWPFVANGSVISSPEFERGYIYIYYLLLYLYGGRKG